METIKESKQEMEPCRTCGMELRDYFAAKAINAHLMVNLESNHTGPEHIERIAEGCYFVADAMLKQRAKPSTPKEGGK